MLVIKLHSGGTKETFQGKFYGEIYSRIWDIGAMSQNIMHFCAIVEVPRQGCPAELQCLTKRALIRETNI